MISFLQGQVKHKFGESIILLAGEVGYLVTPTPRLHLSLNLGSQAEVYIYTHVREDTLDLYGFRTIEELAMFKLILNVSGIGPKTALLVIDQGVSAVQTAIQTADTAFFSLIPRLGTKNAQKIIIELKNKLGGFTDLDLNQTGQTSELIEALEAMGYTRQEALRASRNIDTKASLEVQLSQILRQMDRR